MVYSTPPILSPHWSLLEESKESRDQTQYWCITLSEKLRIYTL